MSGLWRLKDIRCSRPTRTRETIVAMARDGSAGGSGLEPMLRKLEYWQKFTADDRAALLSLPHTVKTLEQHHYIVREFDRAEFTCVLLSGFAIRHKIVAGGQRQILSIHMKGDVVDLQSSLLGHADHSVQMLTAGKAALIPRRTPRLVEIGDWRKLAETGDFNSAYLHLNDADPALAN